MSFHVNLLKQYCERSQAGLSGVKTVPVQGTSIPVGEKDIDGVDCEPCQV